MYAFPKGVSIYTSVNDSEFKCLTATQTSIDLEARKAVYLWHLKGPHGAIRTNVTFHVREGHAPEEVTYFLDNGACSIL
ncbi:hypothetical protein MTO96_035413 [Rhipicephalus appendiculatus]